jgi:hypothetical protein
MSNSAKNIKFSKKYQIQQKNVQFSKKNVKFSKRMSNSVKEVEFSKKIYGNEGVNGLKQHPCK